jgi:hypothetical protein
VIKEELYTLLGHQDIHRDLDVRTLVFDVIREKLTQEQLTELFWQYLADLDENFVRGYFYRRR